MIKTIKLLGDNVRSPPSPVLWNIRKKLNAHSPNSCRAIAKQI